MELLQTPTKPKVTKAMMLLREGDKDLEPPFTSTSPAKKSEIPINKVQQLIKQREDESKRNNIDNRNVFLPSKLSSTKKNMFVGKKNITSLETKTEEKFSKSEIERMGDISKSMSNSPSTKNLAKLRKIQMSISSSDLTLKKMRNITPKLNKVNNIKAKRIITVDSINNWIDLDQTNLKIASFVCRMIEIKHWIEAILEIDIRLNDSNIHEFPDYLTNGILICKLAQHFDSSIKKIYTGGKTDDSIEYKMINKRYNYIDNISEFLKFAHNIKLPNLFIFETNDLYMKKNIPKVIACLHALSHFMAMINKAPLVTKLDNDKKGISAYLQSLNIGIDNLNRIKHVVGSEICGRKYIEGFDEAIRVNAGNNINHLTLIQVEDETSELKPKPKFEQATVSPLVTTSTLLENDISEVVKHVDVQIPNDSFTFLTIDEESENSLTMSGVDLSPDNETINIQESAVFPHSPILNQPTIEDQYVTNDARKLFNNIEYTNSVISPSHSITAIQAKYKFMMDEDELAILHNSAFFPETFELKNCDRQLQADDAAKLQSLCRGYITRFDLFVTRSMLKGNIKNITNFQSICRGALFRRKLNTQRNSSLASFSSFQKEDQYGSSVVMKKILKNKAAYPHLLVYEYAITDLQSIIRGQTCRNQYKFMRRSLLAKMESTIKLQSFIRGFKTRKLISQNNLPIMKTRVRKQPLQIKQNFNLSLTKSLNSQYYDDDDELYEKFAAPDLPSKFLPRIPESGGDFRESDRRNLKSTYISNLPTEPTTPLKIESSTVSRIHLSPTKTDLARILSTVSSVDLKPTILFASETENKKELLLDEFECGITKLCSIIRGNIMRGKYDTIRKKLAKHQNEILTLQSTLRGVETKLDFDLLVEDLEDFDEKIKPLQSKIRGILLRKQLAQRENWFLKPDNYRKICKLQAIIKGLQHVSDYRALIEEKNPPLKAIKNFIGVIGTLELENANQKELKMIQLKQEIKSEKANVSAQLERLADLKEKVDILKKYGIDIKNIQSALKKNVDVGNAVLRHLVDVDDFVAEKDKKRVSVKKKSDQLSTFVGTFFWVLQNQPEYWSDVLNHLETTGDLIEFSSGNIEDWVLKSFNYADVNSKTGIEPTKEEALLVKLIVETFKLFISRTPEKEFKGFLRKRRDVRSTNIKNWELLIHAYLNLPQQRNLTKSILKDALFLITGDDDASFECEPEVILTHLMDETNLIPFKYVDQYEAGEIDALQIPIVEKIYIKNMQNLRASVYEILQTLKKNIPKLPMFIRVLLHEFHELIKEKYSLSSNYTLYLVGSVFIHCYVLPILNSPSNFSIDIEAISNDSNVISNVYRNLELAVVCLTQITTFKHFDPKTHPYLTSLNSFIDEIREEMQDFISELINISSVDIAYRRVNLETDSLRSLKIQSREVFELADILKSFMFENYADEQDVLYFCTKEIGKLEKTSSLKMDSYGFTEIVLDDDENNEENTNVLIGDLLLLEVKKYLIYIIQIQGGDNLIDMLVSEIQPADEMKFKELVKSEKRLLNNEGIDVRKNEIYKMSFPQVKKHTLELIFELEKLHFINSQDGYQRLLNDLANDIKNKRKQQQDIIAERETVIEILTELKRRVSTYKRAYDDYDKIIKLTLNERLKKNLENSTVSIKKENNANIFQKLFSKSGRKMKKLKMKNYSIDNESVYGSHTMNVTFLIDKNVVSEASSSRASITFSCDKPGFFLITIKGVDTTQNRFSTSINELLSMVCKNQVNVKAFNEKVTFVCVGLLKLVLGLFYS